MSISTKQARNEHETSTHKNSSREMFHYSGVGKWADHVLYHEITNADDNLHATEVVSLPLDEDALPMYTVAWPVMDVIHFAHAAAREKDEVCAKMKEAEKRYGSICKRHGIGTKQYKGTGNPPKYYKNSSLLQSGQKYVYFCKAPGHHHRFKKLRCTSIVDLTFASYLNYIDSQIADASFFETAYEHTSFSDFFAGLETADAETRDEYRPSDEYEEYEN